MSLSKSKYCSAIQCPKLLWLSKYKQEEMESTGNESVLENGTNVGILAQELFSSRIDIEFNSDLSIMINDTKKAIESDAQAITEASFNYDGNFCSVDILKRENDKFQIYEVKSSSEVKDIYIHDVAYQYFVLKSLNVDVNKCYVIHINSHYERIGELNLKELFKIVDVTDKILTLQEELKNNIKYFKEVLSSSKEPENDLGLHCFNPYNCPFFRYCSRNLPKNNIFDIMRMRVKTKIDFYKSGKISFEDLINEKMNDNFKEQIEFELYNKKDKCNIKKIKEFLDTLSYPIYFLDFETFEEAVPSYDYMRPYMQTPFQYSLHYIENENGELLHKEFLKEAGEDPRQKLAETLVNDIPKNACTVAYNMSFEKAVIKNLAHIYPDLSEHLMNIYDNMHDLMIPFKNHDYYSKDMKGSFSIKKVLPALFKDNDELNYANLEGVHNGSEAMNSYEELAKLSGEEKEKLRKNLLKYCELDTYAMVKIWGFLKSL